MLVNYLIASFRSLIRDRFFVLVNLFSVAIAFSLGTLAYFNWDFNASFNKYFPNADHIYKVNATKVVGEDGLEIGISPLALANHLTGTTDGHLEVTRYVGEPWMIKVGNELFREQIGFVDENFLDVFPYETLQGHTGEPLTAASVVISKALATRLFGNQVATGQSILLVEDSGEQHSFVVSSVLDEWPSNTGFSFSMLMSIRHYVDFHDIDEANWGHWVDGTFVESIHQTPSSIQADLNQALPVQNASNPQLEIARYTLQNLVEWAHHERELAMGRFRTPLHPASMVGLLSSAVCVMLLAGFNFANTAIAVSAKRLKEIGVRKALGGSRKNIIIMLVIENIMQLLVALMLSGVFTMLLVPQFNALFSVEIIQPNHSNLPAFAVYLLVLWLLMGLLAAGYPAIYISRFQTIEIFRQRVKLSGKNYFTKTMLAFEFIIVFYNLFALGAYFSNARYQESLDKGYQMDGVLNIPLYEANNYLSLRDEADRRSSIEVYGGTQDIIGFGAAQMTFEYEGAYHQVEMLQVSTDYLKTIGIRLQQGRFFLGEQRKDEIIINELLDRKLGGSMLDQQLTLNGEQYKVIGVIDDFKNKPTMVGGKMEPTVLFQALPSAFQYLAMKARTGDAQSLKREMEVSWVRIFPNLLYRGFPQEESMFSVRQTNNIIIKINLFVTIIAVVISVLGLYTLVALGIQRRSKEFGIRKVLGANTAQIFYLINRDLLLLVAIAGILALPAAGYFTKSILDIVFTYHIQLSGIYYIIPLLAVLIIAIGSVGFRAWKSASSNPVVHLRSE
ncbi:MAG: FtsX-like permease family protein [Bacteroidota bacterium]